MYFICLTPKGFFSSYRLHRMWHEFTPCISMCFPLSRRTLHFNSRCKCEPGGTELTISWLICRDKPHHLSLLPHCSLHPIKLMALIDFTDVIKKTNYHKLVIYHPHEDYRPRPGTSSSLTISVSPLPSHTALSVFSTSYGWSQLYISHTHSQTVTQSVIYESVWSN